MNALCSGGQGTPFEGCFGFSQFAELGAALLFGLVLVVLPVAFLIAVTLVRLFRSRVEKSMRATEGASVDRESHFSTSTGPLGSLTISVLDVRGERSDAVRSAPVLGDVRRHARGMALMYAAAVSVQPLLLATVLVAVVPFTPTRNVTLKVALLYTSFFLVNATPLVLVPAIILTKRLSSLVLAVLALIVVLWSCDRAVGGDLIGIWFMIAGVATVAVLLLSTRRLRAAGPIVLAAAMLFSYCTAGGMVYAAALAWNAMGPVRFVREDLAQLPVVEGMQRYLNEMANLPPRELLAVVMTFVAQPTSVMKPAHPEALTTKMTLQVWGLSLAGAVVGAFASFAFVRWLAVHYRMRRASDQMLTVDVWMAIFTLSSLVTLTATYGPAAGACAVAAFGAYSLTVHAGLRRRRRARPAIEPGTLLFLRVFGFDRRTQRLLWDVGQQWRYLGPIRLIGGADLANSTLEPHEFFEFLSGHLTRAFVRDRDDLARRLADNVPSPDPDGLFRIEDFYCFEDTWRMTLSAVAPKANAVLMDLRGFSASNQGCVFELVQLIAVVAVPRIVLLIDRATDQSFLERTLRSAWQGMPGDSPNRSAGDHRLRVLLASSSHRRTLDALMGLLCDTIHTPAASLS